MLAWWHPSKGGLPGLGARGRASDVHLWLPYVVARYVRATGDRALLDEPAPFLEGAAVPRGADGIVLSPRVSRDTASVYQHCRRAIARTLARRGAHGLPAVRKRRLERRARRASGAPGAARASGSASSCTRCWSTSPISCRRAEGAGCGRRRSRRSGTAARGARVDVARRALHPRHHRRGRGARLRGCADRRLAGPLGRGRLRAGTPRRRERARAPGARRPGAAAGAALRRRLASVPGPDRGLSARRAGERRAVLARRLVADRRAGAPVRASRRPGALARRRRGCAPAPSRSGSRSLRSPSRRPSISTATDCRRTSSPPTSTGGPATRAAAAGAGTRARRRACSRPPTQCWVSRCVDGELVLPADLFEPKGRLVLRRLVFRGRAFEAPQAPRGDASTAA